jgi:putative exosortase-associated protein (TIGR04073 family)
LKWLSFIFLLTLSTAAWSDQRQPTGIAESDPSIGATRKLGRGAANVTLGWIELLKGVQTVSEEKGFLAGVTWGSLFGAVNAVKRTAVGVSEVLTFPAPGTDNYRPILEPEFVLGEENNGR